MVIRFSEEHSFDYSCFFSRAVHFLHKYRWIFCSNNTKFIRTGVLHSMPQDWADDLSSATNEEFNRIPLGFCKDSWCPSFQEFLFELQQLSVGYEQHNGGPIGPRKGINIKKCYEITCLTSFVCEKLRPSQTSELLIDFGSGLGHYSQFVYERYGLSVLGIEGNPRLVETAQKRQSDLYFSSKEAVQYVSHFITDESSETIRREVTERFPKSQHVSITGLHACADLSISAIQCFLRCAWVQQLIIMPCCYHKMQPKANGEQFQNVPLSAELARVLGDSNSDIICRSFLRLGCQQTAARWKDLTEDEHLRHGRVMFRRGLIDAILNDDESVKIGKLQAPPDETTAENLFEQFTLQNSGTDNSGSVQWTDAHRAKLVSLLKEYPDGQRLSEYLECLQTCLQSVCENLILLDRMCYMEEASERCGLKIRRNLVRLQNDGLSPRCFILYASKSVIKPSNIEP